MLGKPRCQAQNRCSLAYYKLNIKSVAATDLNANSHCESNFTHRKLNHLHKPKNH